MGAPISDDTSRREQDDSRKLDDTFSREQGEQLRAAFVRKLHGTSAPSVPLSAGVHQNPQTRSEFSSRPQPTREPPPRATGSTMALIGRITKVVTFTAIVVLLTIFAKPLWQGARALLSADSQVSQELKPEPSLSPNSPALGQEPRSTFRGVTDGEIRFGISAALSGPTKELGQNMKTGITAAFNMANASGGVHGRQLRLIAADDGYEPVRAAETMKQLYEKEQVFGVVGNVGTPTAVVALPYALERKMLFFGAFTGAGLLRNNPPDRYVFNYRASYAEETEATVHYLVKVRHLKTNQIAVFAQQDAYGDSGFAGVAKAIRSLGGIDSAILRLNYQRNTVDVDEAVAQLQAEQQKRNRLPIRAVIMVPTYRAAAKFIEKTRNLYPDMIYTSVSFVGSTALANELMLLGKKYVTGVIVTQVVPALDGHSSLVLDYKSALAKYFPGEAPDYVSLEGYVAANVLIAALKRNGPEVDTERLVATLENLRDLDLGLGTLVTFSRSEHQGVHKVWGTQLDETGHYQAIDLQ
jgi:ABC-type branched-subunit amino acid transport system substrate-binding protein